MPVFQVRIERSNAIVWTGSATEEGQALEAMAHAAGYRSRTELPETITKGGLVVESLHFEGPMAAERITGGRGASMERGRSARSA